MENSSDPLPTWHALPVEQTFSILKSSDDGLSSTEALARLSKHGPNHIERGPRRGVLKILLIAFEAREPDLMDRPPKPPDEPLIGPFLVFRTFLVGALMTMGAMSLFFYEYHSDLAAGIAPVLARSQTVAVTTIILFQCAYLLNCRSLTESAFRIGLFSNLYVYFGIAATLVLQLCFVYMPPLNALFHTHPLDATDWIAPTLVALAGLPVLSLEKHFWRRRSKSAHDAVATQREARRP